MTEWTDVMGQTMIGRKEIEDGHTYPFTTELNSSYVEEPSVYVYGNESDCMT